MKRWVLKWEWLILIGCGVIVLRAPSWFEPYWYGDEGIYLTIGQAINSGLRLYSEIYDNKPPMIYVLAAIADGQQFWMRMLLTGWNVVTLTVFGVWVNKLYAKTWQKAVTVGVLAGLTSLPWWEGNIANAEMFFLGCSIAAISLAWSTNKPRWLVLAGVILGTGGLIKAPALVEVMVLPMVWLATRDRQWLKKSVWFGSGVILPVIVSFGYFGWVGSGKEYVEAAWLQNVGYVTSWKPSSEAVVFSLKGRVAILAVGLGAVVVWGKKLGKANALVLAWAMLAMFGALVSGRPYPHYLLQVAPAWAVAVGNSFGGKKVEKWIGVGVSSMVIVVYWGFGFYNYPVVGYYKNFLEWSTGRITQDKYFERFDPQVITNYKVAEWLKAGTEATDKIFVWGDQPILYAMTERLPVGKYTARYHIKERGAEEETMAQLITIRPKYVVSMARENELPGLAEWLIDNYRGELVVGNAKVLRRIDQLPGEK